MRIDDHHCLSSWFVGERPRMFAEEVEIGDAGADADANVIVIAEAGVEVEIGVGALRTEPGLGLSTTF